MRRLSALLTSILMLHLMLVGSDLMCASDGGAGMVMGAVGRTGMPHDATMAAGQSAQNSATPTQNRCCEAMSSCSVTTTVGVVARLITLAVASSGTPSYASDALASVLTAPDPPPPKA